MKHLGLGSIKLYYLIAIEHPIGLAIGLPYYPVFKRAADAYSKCVLQMLQCLSPITFNNPNKTIPIGETIGK